MALPTQTSKPNGLHQRYLIKKIVPIKNPRKGGNKFKAIPVDEGAEYFVMRVDWNGRDQKHIEACRAAVVHYAELIKDHLPELAKDLFERYRVKRH